MNNRKPFFYAEIKSRDLLTKLGSSKKTYHIVLDVATLSISFKVGDALAIYADNDPFLVARLIEVIKEDPETVVIDPRTQETTSLKIFLTKKVDISRLNIRFLKLFSHDYRIQELLEEKEKRDRYMAVHEIIDFLTTFHLDRSLFQSFLLAFFPLLPRFYSVASSPVCYPGEIHLVVALSSYQRGDQIRYGVATDFLCHRAEVSKTALRCYIQSTPYFTLPNDETPIIMLGPGTGIAPFIGFLQERGFRKASGKNWLFFGARNREYDFFYKEFLNFFVQKGELNLDLAFSRDGVDKVYVQHRLYEKRSDVWLWLQEGAHIYVCGEANPMAKDVDRTLHQICEEEGGLSSSLAKLYVQQLRQKKRYLTDTY